jgi:HK97 gp10 family phage protein
MKEIDYSTKVLAAVYGITAERLKESGEIVKKHMRDECPKKSGELRKSIRVRNYPAKNMVQIVAGNKRAFYVHMVLFGTHHSGIIKGKLGINKQRISKPFDTRPNNFMERAYNKSKAELKQLWGREIGVKVGHTRRVGFFTNESTI